MSTARSDSASLSSSSAADTDSGGGARPVAALELAPPRPRPRHLASHRLRTLVLKEMKHKRVEKLSEAERESAQAQGPRLLRRLEATGVAAAAAPAVDVAGGKWQSATHQFFMDVQFHDLGLTLKSGSRARVLDGVSGALRHSHVCAVMGPSGSGKTTFLTALAGKAYYGRLSGEVLINGERGSLSSPKFKHLVAFVPQEDVMMRDMTVAENIAHSALTRLPAAMPRAAKLAFAESIISLLELNHIRDSRIGDESERGISGGQRKRVNVGLEVGGNSRAPTPSLWRPCV